MEDLKDILKELIKIRKELDLKDLSDDTLCDCGVRIFNAQAFKINNEPPKEPQEKATDKQIWRLKKIGHDNLDFNTLTKIEATRLIAEASKNG